jgi:CubicO group peptidase (beta-lactamase class C family)
MKSMVLLLALVFPWLLAGAATPRDLTRPDVEAWLDGYVPWAIARDDIAGAVVVVVKDGEVLFQRGYGLADVARRIPVDADRTLFRTGSVGKLFTWTAVMQLVEQGQLDLDRDINDYLDFRIPGRDDGPITLRQLMTHTPGFEEVLKNLVTDDAASLLSLETYVKTWTPRRIYPAGQVPAYSNYGVALAGYIVERVAGEPLDAYLERRVFAPLGMRGTTTRQPLPARLESRMSKGYGLGSGKPGSYDLVGPSPAGSAAASGADMGRFMIAWLQGGQLGAARILRTETVARTLATPLPVIPPLNSMQLGFFTQNPAGRRIVGHDGDLQQFHTTLNLFPDDGVGLYFAINSNGLGDAAIAVPAALINAFADRYFPVAPDTRNVDPDAARAHAKQMSGTYASSRQAQSTFLSLFSFLSQEKVRTDAAGQLIVPGLVDAGGEPMRWREVTPYVWQQVGGPERLAARLVGNDVEMFSVDSVSPFLVLQPVPWWRTASVLGPLVVVALGVFLITVIARPLGAVVRRRYRIAAPVATKESRLAWFAALALLLVALGWMTLVSQVSIDLATFGPRLDPWISLFRITTGIVCVGALTVTGWHAGRQCASEGSWTVKLGSALQVISCAAVLWLAVACRLIGYSADY